MADTLTNVTIEPNTWTDLYAKSGVAVGTRVLVRNVGTCDTYISKQAVQPTKPHDAYEIMLRGGNPFDSGIGTSGLWVFCQGCESKLNVEVIEANIDLPLTSFGEALVAEPTPIAQITAQYGLLDKDETFLLNGGTADATNSLFEVNTGSDPDGFAAILTRRQVTYRAGQGLLARITALFDTPQTDSVQQAGLIINTDRFAFGYEGLTYGIVYEHDGESEIQELTFTVASGNENATITVDGTPYIVPLTVGGVDHNAFETANSLNTQVDDYTFSSNGATVVARSLFAGSGAAFAFTSSTAVASWSQVQSGQVNISDFIPQSEWNVDKRPDVNPMLGNVYEIKMQYLGFGGIEFYIEDSTSAQLRLVHRIKFANTSTTPSVGNPTFRVGWLVQNSGNTTPLTLKGASAAGFVEGKAVATESPRAFKNTNPSVGTGAFENILTIRNRIVFGTRRNRTEVFGLNLSATTDSTKAAIIDVIKNADITGDVIYDYIDKDRSVIEVATNDGIVTGGQLVASFVIPTTGGIVVNLEELLALILSGETLTIAAQITSGSASSVTAATIWQEDL